jgi:hypothetical protein
VCCYKSVDICLINSSSQLIFVHWVKSAGGTEGVAWCYCSVKVKYKWLSGINIGWQITLSTFSHGLLMKS